jgi:hypothetical protein
VDEDWQAVDEYVKSRVRRRGDVFGWLRQEGVEAGAVILVSAAAKDEPFPATLGGIRVTLQTIQPPRRFA